MGHSDDEIELAAERFDELAGDLDPDSTPAGDVEDLGADDDSERGGQRHRQALVRFVASLDERFGAPDGDDVDRFREGLQ